MEGSDLEEVDPIPPKKSFLEVMEMAKQDSKIKKTIRVAVNRSRLDRLLSLARSGNDMMPLFKKVNLFPLIGKLDHYRMKNVGKILEELAELTKPLDEKQQRSHFHHILKSLYERPSLTMSIQSTLKKLVAEAERARDFAMNLQIAGCISTELAHLLTLPKDNSLTSIYYTRLKLENIQLFLELPMIMYNQTEFPYSFTMFTYFYTQFGGDLFKVFAQLTRVFSQEVAEENPHVKSFNEMLRGEVLKRLVLILESFRNWGCKEAEEEEEASQLESKDNTAREERRDAVRYTIASVIDGAIELVKAMPR